MKKKILIALCVVVVLIAGGVVYLFMNMDSIVKSLVEKVGTEAVGTQVSLGSVNVSLMKGKATIKDLRVANPEGFSKGSMIKFGEITAQIDYKTHVIKNIHVGNPEFLFEQKGLQTNFGVIQKKLKSNSPAKSKEVDVSADSGTEKVESSAEAKVFQIDSFTINDAKIYVVSLDSGHKAKASAANITFSSLKGTPNELCVQILIQIVEQVIQQSAGSTVKQVINKNVKGDLGKVINKQLDNFKF